MATDVNVPSVNLQTEITATSVNVPSVNLQTEIIIHDAIIPSLNLQVEVIIPLYSPPTVTTTSPVTNTTETTTDVAGEVTDDGGATITERGFCYGTSANPTTANSKKTVAGTTGTMSATLTGLTPNTTYHVRAYATNSQGTSYGADVSWTSVIRQGVLLEILEYQSTETAEASTSKSQIIITGHGLNAGDFIVNTSRWWTGAERGSRLVGSVGWDADTIPVSPDVVGGEPGVNYGDQASGDSIRLYKFTDRTPLIKSRTFRLVRRSSGKTEATFTLKTTADYIPRAGQYVRINWNVDDASAQMFLGVLRSVRIVGATEMGSDDTLFLDCTCVGLNQIPSRRTVQINYEADEVLTYGDIVQDMLDNYLVHEGIRASTIDAGEVLQDDWVSDVISVSEVLDECASKSGYQWFIDDEGLLNFYQDPGSITDAVEDIVDGGTFKDYTDIEFEESIDNYVNKVFVVGGRDAAGDNEVLVGSEDFTESQDMQEICAGTGVYGTVMRDAGVTEATYEAAEAGTTTTNIKVTGHGQLEGYMLWNLTRNEFRQIKTVVNDDNLTVEAVTSQTTGDDIVFFNLANTLIQNELKLRGFVPKTFSFKTHSLDFNPRTRIKVDLAKYGVSNQYFVIDDVEIFDEGGTVDTFACRVTCSLRDNANFSTQRLPSYYDYFGGFG